MSKNTPPAPPESKPRDFRERAATICDRDLLNLEIAQQISNLRKEKGWTRADLASEIGLADTKLQQYESGKLSFQSALLHQIAKALSVPVDRLFGMDSEPDQTSAPPPTLNELYGLANDFSRIKSKTRKRALLKLVQAIADSKMGRAAQKPDSSQLS